MAKTKLTGTEARQKVINDLYAKYGEVTASKLVETAKAKSSPIHDQFEWDNDKASHEYRLIQARRIIKVTPVTYVYPEKELDVTGSIVTEPMIHVPSGKGGDDKEGSYQPMSVVVQSEDKLERALRELKAKCYGMEDTIDALEQAATTDINQHVTYLKSRVSQINKTIKTIKAKAKP